MCPQLNTCPFNSFHIPQSRAYVDRTLSSSLMTDKLLFNYSLKSNHEIELKNCAIRQN